MTKIERDVLSKKISKMAKQHKYSWQELKEQIADYGYQVYYVSQDDFKEPIKQIVENLSDNEKGVLINEWKKQKQRSQFETDKEYLENYKLYIMEELVRRATVVAYR